MRARPLVFGYSWLGILNQLLLQWFFIRLEAMTTRATHEVIALRIVYPVVPLTGWWFRYVPAHPRRSRLLWATRASRTA